VARVEPVLQEHLLSPATMNGAIWRYSREHPKLYHFHGQLELLLVKRGSTLERVGSRVERAHAGQMLWHLPGLPHRQIEASSDLDLRVLHFEPHLLRDSAALFLSISGRPLVEPSSRDFDRLLDYCDATTDEHGNALIDRTRELELALAFALEVTRSGHDDRRQNSLVELACGLLLEDPSLDRDRVCRVLDVSGGYLSRRFAAELGTSFQDQRSRLRLTRFVTEATRTRRSWLEASLAAGFGSYSQLHRVFCRAAGSAPLDYLTRGGRNRRALVPA
jgi:AraC-like DNA-binding protein